MKRCLPYILFFLITISANTVVSAQPVPNINVAGAEYFWGTTDPGEGLGSPITATDGNLDEAVENLLSTGQTPPLTGANLFNVRMQDADGNWGTVFSTVVQTYTPLLSTNVPLISVTVAEYFWDTDPGEGSGTALIAFDGALDEAVEKVFATGVAVPGPAGPHTFNIRVQDEDNQWGALFITVVHTFNPILSGGIPDIRISTAEYFWDTDPGEGNGTPLVAFDGAFDEAVETAIDNGIPVPGPTGSHSLNFRILSDDGTWGDLFTTIVHTFVPQLSTNVPAITIAQAEYFWDTDPGEGSGSPLLAFDGAFDEAVESIFENGLILPGPVGPHTFNVRVKDAFGVWGPIFTTVIHSRLPATQADIQNIKVIQAEYFWDTDPGEGSGSPILALDGALDEAVETLLETGISHPYPCTNHLFNVRVKDGDNVWGPLFKTVIFVEDTLKPIAICQDATVELDVSGNGILDPMDIDGGSTDNCEIVDWAADNTSFTCIEVGTQTVTLTVTDIQTNTAACDAIVTVEDNVLPEITCPAPVTIGNDPGQCGAVVSWTEPEGTDNCTSGGTLAGFSYEGLHKGNHYYLSDDPATGATSSEGLANAQALALSFGGNVVTISDAAENSYVAGIATALGQSVVIGFTDELSEGNFGWVSGEAVTFTNWNSGEPNDGGGEDHTELGADGGWNDIQDFRTLRYVIEVPAFPVTTRTAGLAPGSLFPVATTAVTYEVVDASGNTGSCSFDVVVNDTEDPTVVCPSDINADNDAGQCSALVSFIALNQDNCELPAPVLDGFTFNSTWNGSHYYVSNGTGTLPGDAQAAAVSFGGNLATINSVDENIHVNSIAASVGGLQVGIGFTDELSEGNFGWYSGEAVTYTNWNSGEPNNFNDEDYTVLASDIAGQWFDIDGAGWSARPFVIEIPATTSLAVQTAGITSGSAFPVGTSNVTFTATDVAGNTATCSFSVTVSDTEDPVITCPANVSVDVDEGECTASGVVLDTPTTSDNCAVTGVSDDGPTIYPLGVTPVTWTALDAAGNSAQCTQTVTVTDGEPPVINCPGNITLSNDNGICGAVHSWTVPVPSDNCNNGAALAGFSYEGEFGGSHYYVSNAPANTLAEAQASAIAFGGNVATINDAAENGFVDGIATAIGSLMLGFTDEGSEGNFGWVSGEAVSYTNWNSGEPNNSGAGEDYTEMQAGGGWNDVEAFNNSRYIIELPVILPVTRTEGPAPGSIFPVAATTVTYSVIDGGGNTAMCSFTVTVNDTEDPVVTCPADISVNTDAGVCGATVSWIDPLGIDNCPFLPASIPGYTFEGEYDNGYYYVSTSGAPGATSSEGLANAEAVAQLYGGHVATINDASENSFIQGLVGSLGQNLSIGFTDELNEGSFGWISGEAVTYTNWNGGEPNDAGGEDHTEIDAGGGWNDVGDFRSISNVIEIPQFVFVAPQTAGLASSSVFPVGTMSITHTITDAVGNTDSCMFNVIVTDNEPPTALCEDITVALDENGQVNVTGAMADNGSTDNCGITAIALNNEGLLPYDCNDIGTHTNIEFVAQDSSGNVSDICFFDITVEDTLAPDALCEDITVALDENGQVNVTGAMADNGSTDNCGITAIALNNEGLLPYDCNDIGTHTNIEFVAQDSSGNVSDICFFDITVEDPLAPDALCQDITVALDENGQVNVTGAMADNGSTDNCGITAIALNNEGLLPYDCNGIGTHTNIEFVAQDSSGNVSDICFFDITVEDTLAPIAVCLDVTVYLDPSGIFDINGPDGNPGNIDDFPLSTFDGGSSDNCAIWSLAIDQSTFDCNDIGSNTVMLTVSDSTGNNNVCPATLTVLDTIPPTPNCQDITVELDAMGKATIDPMDLVDATMSNCGPPSMTLNGQDSLLFTCADLGSLQVIVVATEPISGQQDSCLANITIEDPLAGCLTCDSQQIVINAGWNMISGYIIPDLPDLTDVFSGIDQHIIIVKDGLGQVYFPSIPFNQIGNWNLVKGYQVKAWADTILTIGCNQADPETTPITVPSGWSIISYLRDDPMDAAAALASLGDTVLIAKNNAGQMYIPSMLNTIGDLLPGQGYQVKLTEASTLLYPANTARYSGSGTFNETTEASHYIIDKNTGNNSSVIIPNGAIDGLQYGDEIGVFNSNGLLTGSVVYEDFHMGLTIWGTDALIGGSENMAEGEPYRYKLWRPSLQQEFPLYVEYSSGSAHFTSNGLSYVRTGKIDGLNDEVLDLQTQVFVYPNPANHHVSVEVWLPEASNILISIYDVYGRKAIKIHQQTILAGESIIDLDISELASGNYFYRLEMKDHSYNGSLIKIK